MACFFFLIMAFKKHSTSLPHTFWYVAVHLKEFSDIFFKIFFLEKGEGREEEERNINVPLPLRHPLLGTWPATQACALTGDGTGNPLVRRWASTEAHQPGPKFFLKDFIYLFLERGEGKEKERERHINVWLPVILPVLGTWPATQACALTGNRTSDPLVHRPVLNPLSYASLAPPHTLFFFNSSFWPLGDLGMC